MKRCFQDDQNLLQSGNLFFGTGEIKLTKYV